ncbi:MAG: hypothetical protein A3H44_06360 [Gammaproteobacteria bacterium RIFCSPLOWO2_02_FULL_57_10]|nr:MAG: hypothetical protein A3H44_06360 [Gammaproteobacteria bacterium RIFCSPLOWO2_02_FULL_57_10]
MGASLARDFLTVVGMLKNIASRARSHRGLYFYHLEVFLADATIRAAPVIGDIFPAGARRDAFIGQAKGFVVEEFTNQALPFLHVDHHQLQLFEVFEGADDTP